MAGRFTTARAWIWLSFAVVAAGVLIAWWIWQREAPPQRAAAHDSAAASSNPGDEPPGSRPRGRTPGSGAERGPGASTASGGAGAADLAGGPAQAEVSGRVSGQDGAPVGFVDVIFSNRGGEATATSDETGAYSLRLGPGSYRVRAIGDRVMAIGLEPLTLGAEPRRYDIRVQEHSVIRGRVRHRDGSPAAGAIVVPHFADKRASGASARGELGSASAQDDGSFELFTLQGDLIVSAGSASAAGSAAVPGLAAGDVRENIDIVLVPNGYVEGVVRGPGGQEIGDARVLVSMQIPGTGEYDRIPVSTDARGHFRYQVIRPGHTIVEALARGFAQSAPIDFRLAPGESRAGLVLGLVEATKSLSGHVTDASGAPLSFVQVAQGRMGSKARFKKTYTDADGAFTVSGLGPGPHRLRFRKHGHEQMRRSNLEAPGADIRVVMPRAEATAAGGSGK